ncbi:hypothetical protein EB796_022639 [Bugula neritina]|uniref:HTH psq-type domain-containing protein n=1 Tax=Bugula neritina TaxID=10212 RepID=A0A7J7J0Q3_BUGNE|nr:hypothetical protein EB796_022639 [Bugula neritina]
MVRNRKPTKRTRPDDSTIAEAVECVMNNTMSIRKASAMIGMHRATLHRAIAKRRNAPNGNKFSSFQPIEKNPNPKYLQIHQSNCNLSKRN